MTGCANLRQGAVSLSAEEFRALRDFLYERSGLYFAENKKYLLENRLARCMEQAGAETVAQYLGLLRSPTRGRSALMNLLDAVTTHETSFFRHRAQLEAFQRQVLPRLIEGLKKRGRRSLRLWSAACSSGEEPYTLAMLILETLGPGLGGWDVRIYGTDIAHSMIQKARGAEYTRYSFRGTPAYYAQKYFDVLGPDRFRVKEEVRNLVEFGLLNFADDLRMGRMRGFQTIFCRNALIYFDKPAKRRFVAHFYRALDPGGYLFVGHSESLHGITDEFKLVHFPGAMGYLKPPVP
ncbi:MAG: protein-glutamate O-methyltransferase CheR [Deltaproteobacteria bacterium]|nr:protein-glutamate O-methyltransferase CheR [Deltaproteobacteria bacterium]